jgi:putative Ca2+/H+ antiporter (TMEM165/GDT1 family)
LGFSGVLEGVIIVCVGGFMALAGFGMISFGNAFYSYVPWLVGIRPYSFPMAIAFIIFGVALLLFGKKMTQYQRKY